jgi:hypothetical protein
MPPGRPEFSALTRTLRVAAEDRKIRLLAPRSANRPATKADLLEMEILLMSAVTDFAAAVQANFAQIQTGITALDAQIQAFNNSPGTLSASDQAALNAILASSATLATAANSVVSPVVPPAPAA